MALPQWLQDLLFGLGAAPPPPPPPRFGQWIQPYNSQELASYKQARVLVAAINSTPLKLDDGDPRIMGGGVLSSDDEVGADGKTTAPANPGIFIPLWVGGPGGFEQPHATGADGTKYFHLCLRFKNGMTGMNVGLILDKFSRFPMSPSYVIMQIAIEAEGMMR
jgi:hypothetical protein